MPIEDSILDFDQEESHHYRKRPAIVQGLVWYFAVLATYYVVLFAIGFITQSFGSPGAQGLLYIVGMAFALYTILNRYPAAWFVSFGILTYQFSVIMKTFIYYGIQSGVSIFRNCKWGSSSLLDSHIHCYDMRATLIV